MKRFLTGLLILGAPSLMAEEAVTEEVPEWQGNIQFGYVSSSGNTDNTNINAKFNLKHDDENWLHDFNALYYSSSESNVTTAERYKLIHQADYKLETPDTYWFINGSYENDRFSGFDHRATLTTGYGKVLYKTRDMKLDAEIGGGFRYSQQTDTITQLTTNENEAMIRLAAKYLWQIAKERKLTSALSIEEGEESRVTNFEVGFVTMVNGNLSLKTAYEARHVSEVPVGKEKLDTVITVNLLYQF